ncbi:MAG TPA: NAD(P)-binding domain-containing protein, partial [Chitinophagaceae bacterium]|nr:NAD(P)-binding domain-containing protein [Chitinophagaceae bacterium]
MNVVIIGSGNTASILGRKIKANGHAVVQVTGRNAEAVRQLASELDSEPNNDMTHIDRSADLYIAALADSALPGLHQHLSLDKKTIVHTAAAVSRDVLRQVSRNYGVLYPLQTLR